MILIMIIVAVMISVITIVIIAIVMAHCLSASYCATLFRTRCAALWTCSSSTSALLHGTAISKAKFDVPQECIALTGGQPVCLCARNTVNDAACVKLYNLLGRQQLSLHAPSLCRKAC